MKTICVIPARMGSSRFPGKPIKPLLGMPLIQHVYYRCRLSKLMDRVVVATCDQEIVECVEAVGGEAVMTSDCHDRCTDRVEEAINNMNLDLADDDLVLMVQGDEILVSPKMLDDTVKAYQDTKAPVINLASRLYRTQDHDDPNAMKIVFGIHNQVLYYSRSPVPSRFRAAADAPMYQQTGVIAFQNKFLHQFSTMRQTPLEIVESCDMLRVLEHGLPIIATVTDTETIGVDTEADRTRAEEFLARDPITKTYFPG